MQTYTVRREDNKIYILDTVNNTSDLEPTQFITIEDDDTNQVIISNMDTKTVILSDGKIEFQDEKYYNISVKDKLRVGIIKEAKLKMESLVQSVDMITYINYIDINNELYNYGIFITDSNREEKYLEILETGDEHKIDLLEDLLLCKDKLGIVKSAKNQFDNILEAVENTPEDDVESLEKLRVTL